MRPSAIAPPTAESRQLPLVLGLGIIAAMVAGLLLPAVFSGVNLPFLGMVRLPPTAAYLASALFLLAAGFLPAALAIEGRLRAVRDRPPAAPSEQPVAGSSLRSRAGWAARRLGRSLARLRPAPGWLSGWPQVLASLLFASLALVGAIAALRIAQPVPLPPAMQQLIGAGLVLLAFPFLLIERLYAALPREQLAEAPQLERIARLPLAAALLLGLANILQSLGFAWPLTLEHSVGWFIAIVAAELILRAAAMLFIPFAPPAVRRSVADSSLATLLRLTPPTLSGMQVAVRRQLGIDLSRSWALYFVRRAALPLALTIALLAWLVSGLTALGLNERAVYERLGAPVAVLGPGLHVHLPWPLGLLRRIELGTVHEIPVVFSEQASAQARRVAAAPAEIGAEDLPPASSDRLWDNSHPSEASYLIASQTQGKQSFQIVNIDLRVVYRMGLSDQAALLAAYSVADPQALIRAQAGELLVRYFARYTLLDVMGQSRDSLTTEFRRELQQGLDELATGIEVIAVIVEAIHPPSAAANAYHYVQAAEILSRSEISLRRADASRRLKSAEQTAMEDRNIAIAAAAEQVSQASGESVLFEADREAHQRDGRVFLLERWLERLGPALARSSFIALDHRLAGSAAPTIDLRAYAPPALDGSPPGIRSRGRSPAPMEEDPD